MVDGVNGEGRHVGVGLVGGHVVQADEADAEVGRGDGGGGGKAWLAESSQGRLVGSRIMYGMEAYGWPTWRAMEHVLDERDNDVVVDNHACHLVCVCAGVRVCVCVCGCVCVRVCACVCLCLWPGSPNNLIKMAMRE